MEWQHIWKDVDLCDMQRGSKNAGLDEYEVNMQVRIGMY
jgi:hypothetical protein